VGPGVTEILLMINVCFRIIIVRLKNVEFLNANRQAELINSSLLGLTCIL
jgi:hypothetical protein